MSKTPNPWHPEKFPLTAEEIQRLHDAWEAGYKACEKDKEDDKGRS